MEDKSINDQKNESSKISIASCRDHSDNDNNAPPYINKIFVILMLELALQTANVSSFVALH